jgi:hypothetical protein
VGGANALGAYDAKHAGAQFNEIDHYVWRRITRMLGKQRALSWPSACLARSEPTL